MKIILFLIGFLTSIFVMAQDYTLIPDKNFETKLIQLGIDNDGLNGKVLTQDISKIKKLKVDKASIENLQGIEGFKSLK